MWIDQAVYLYQVDVALADQPPDLANLSSEACNESALCQQVTCRSQTVQRHGDYVYLGSAQPLRSVTRLLWKEHAGLPPAGSERRAQA